MSFLHDIKLCDINAKVKMGERLSFDDGLALFHTEDLNALGKLADTVRRQKHGRTTYFNVNRHFNPTNVCYVDCKFCGFYRTPRQPDAYTHNIDDSLRIAGQAITEGREIIAALLPDVLVKGGDWAGDQIIGREEVEAAGGRVVSVPVVRGYSTTAILAKMRAVGSPSGQRNS